MKRLLILFLIAGLILGFRVAPVSAHVLQTDGNIGAVLHIDPDDDPIAGSQAGFFFEFKDKQNKFDPKLCDCIFIISKQGKQIFSQDLFANNPTPSLDNASVFFTFTKRDVYQVQVVGKPLSPNGFQPFTLNYNVRVDRGEDAAPSNISTSFRTAPLNWIGLDDPFILLGVLSAGIIIGGLLIIRRRFNSVKPSMPTTSPISPSRLNQNQPTKVEGGESN